MSSESIMITSKNSFMLVVIGLSNLDTLIRFPNLNVNNISRITFYLVMLGKSRLEIICQPEITVSVSLVKEYRKVSPA